MQLTVPDHWTADEALTFVAFLEQIINAIWAAHGHAMANQLRRADEQSTDGATRCPPHLDPRHVLDPPDEYDTSGFDDDDIPW